MVVKPFLNSSYKDLLQLHNHATEFYRGPSKLSSNLHGLGSTLALALRTAIMDLQTWHGNKPASTILEDELMIVESQYGVKSLQTATASGNVIIFILEIPLCSWLAAVVCL